MADIRAKLSGLCEAVNAHDLDRIMNFFLTTASWRCREDLTPGALAIRESKRCVKVSLHALKDCRMFSSPMMSISWMQTGRPACPSGY